MEARADSSNTKGGGGSGGSNGVGSSNGGGSVYGSGRCRRSHVNAASVASHRASTMLSAAYANSKTHSQQGGGGSSKQQRRFSSKMMEHNARSSGAGGGFDNQSSSSSSSSSSASSASSASKDGSGQQAVSYRNVLRGSHRALLYKEEGVAVPRSATLSGGVLLGARTTLGNSCAVVG